MASYEAVINLVVQGEAALNRIQKKIDNLYKTVGDLETKKKFQGSQAAASFVREQANELERVVSVSKQQIKEQERSIVRQSKLNAAVDLYERRQRQLSRTSVANQKQFASQIKDIEEGFKFFRDRKSAAGVQAIATELGRIIEYDNEINRISERRTTNQRRLFAFSKEIAKYESFGLQTDRARKTLSNFEQVAGSNQLKKAQQYESALRNQLRLLKDQLTEQKRVSGLAPRSPVLGGAGFPGSPRAVAAQQRAQEAALRQAQRGFPASPIGGTATMLGSPKFLAAQERARSAAERALRAQERSAKAAESAANKEADRVLKESQKGFPSSPIMGTATMAGSPKAIAAQERNRAATERRAAAQRRAEERAAKVQQQVAVAAERAADKALKEAQKGFPSSPILGSSTVEGSPRWKAAQESARQKLESAARAAERAADRALKEAQKGFPSSPILGTATMTGSPRWKAAQERMSRMARGGASKESGFRPALTSAEVKAQINEIVTDFNAVAPKAGSAGDNVVSTFAAELKQGASSAAAAATVFAEAAIKAIKKALRISSPSRVMIEIVENLVSTFVTEIRQSKAAIQAAFEDAFAPKLGSVQKAKPPSSLPGSQDLIEKLASFAGRASARPSIFRQLAQLAGPEILSGGVLPQAMQRKAFEAGKILPETRLLPLSERRLLRGSASAPGGGLEQAIREAAIRAVSSTGAFTGPLSSGVRSPGVVASPLLAPFSQGPAATGGTGLFSVRSQPGIGAPGSAFPFQRYRMGGAQQFPIDGPIAALGGLGTRGEASKAASESIKKYRDAVNNFWEGEDSQFSAVSKVIKSSVQLGGAKLARKLTESGPGAGLQGAIDVITGDQRLGVSSAVSNVSQRFSDSLLNSLEALGFTISDGFKDAIGRVRNAVPSVLGGIGGILPPSGFGGGRGGGGGGAAGAGGPQNIEDLQRSLGFRDLGPIARATGEQIDELTTRLTELRQRIDPTTQDFRELTQQLGVLGREQERRAPGAEFLTRRFGSRGGRAVSEGLIGGAFPLLFGQGIGAAAGGGIGGALGGFAGGGLGFGLSLAGTALGTAFDTAVQGATELGAALNKTTDTFDKVKERALFSSKETERFADRMQEMGFTASASIVAQQEVIRKIGVGGVKSLKELGDSSDRLNRAWAEFNLQLQAALAGPMADLLNWVAGIVEESNKRGRREAETRDVFSGLSSEDQKAFNVEVSKRLSNVSSLPEGAAVEQIAQVRRQVAEEFAKKANIAVGIKVETVDINKQKIAQLTKQLEFVDISRPIIDQVRQAAREQQDLDKQRADLVRSYEESIAQIRKSVEDKIFQQRRQNAQLEVDIRSKAADLELAKLKQANNEFRGIFSDTIAGQTVDRLLNAVESVTEIQNQGAAQRASLELQIQNTVIETEKYKVDVADQVSKLNTETARRVADINEQIRRRNEDFDINRFKLEKTIAELQLKNNEIIAKQQLDTARKNLETARQAGDAQGTAYAQSFVNIYESQLDIIKKGQQDISAISAPAQLRGVGQVGGGGVSTTGLDQATKRGISLQQSLQAVQDQIANINSVGALTGIVDPLEKQIQQTDRLFKIYSEGGGARSKDLAAEALLIEAITQKLAEQKDQTSPLANALSELLVKENGRYRIIALLNKAATASAQEEQLQNLIDKEEELKAQIDLVRSGKAEMSLVDQARLFFAQKGVDLEDEKTKAILRQFGVLDQLSGKLKDITTQQEMQQQLFTDMAGAVASTFSSAFDTAVQGTENLGEALKGLGADLLATIGKMLIMSSLAQLFGGVLGGGAGNPQGIFSMLGKVFGYGAKNGAYFDGNMAYFAKGGVVSSPTLFQFADGGIAQTGLMGEAGPEAIMPLERGPDGKLGVSAKLGNAMGRYRRAPGAAGGPAGGGTTSETAAGGTTTMEPIDVRYSVERINNVEYVTADQFRAGMAQAAQQGAIQGERRAMRTLTNSAAARGRLGI